MEAQQRTNGFQVMFYILGFVFSFYHGKPPSNHHLRRLVSTFSGHPMQIQVSISIHPSNLSIHQITALGFLKRPQDRCKNLKSEDMTKRRALFVVAIQMHQQQLLDAKNQPTAAARSMTSWSTCFPHRESPWMLDDPWIVYRTWNFDVSFSALKRKTCPKVVVFTTLSRGYV